MKKTIIILLSLLMAGTTLSASTVGREKAMEIAMNFFGQKNKHAIKILEPADPVITKSVSSADAIPYFVINNEDGGFVIISNSSSTVPILAYSYENSFDIDHIPDNVYVWMEQLSKVINDGTSRAISPQVAEMWEQFSMQQMTATSSSVKLETAQWNQWAPFNNLCPEDAIYGDRCPTGCVATALAIVMRYWKWPSSGIGTFHKYSYWQETGSGTDGWIDGASKGGGYELGYEYDWNSMPLDGYEQFNEDQQDAVALLMRDCGTAVKTIYTMQFASGAVFSNVDYIKEYFDYDKSFTLRYASNYSSYKEWAEVLKTELDEGRPVLASGGFHAYVIDGYDENGFFSINWGWGGSDNGYFVMDPFISDGNGIYENFFTQSAYIGLQPDRGCEYKYLLEWHAGDEYMSIAGNQYELSKPFNLTNTFLSIRGLSGTTEDYYGDYVAALMNKDGELKAFISEPIPLVGGFINSTDVIECIINEEPDPDDYITILFKSKGYSTWESVLTHAYSDNARIYLNETELLEDNTSIFINPNERLFKYGYVELTTKLMTIKTMRGTSLTIYRSDGTVVSEFDGSDFQYVEAQEDHSQIVHHVFLSKFEPGEYIIELRHSLQYKIITFKI